MRTSILVFFGFLALQGNPQAASFDCSRSATAVERAICHDPALSKVDDDLAAAFADALTATLDPQTLREEQRLWYATNIREDAPEKLRALYESRIESLRFFAERWREVPREVTEDALEKTCVVLPPGPTNAACRVETSGQLQGDSSLRFQLQSYEPSGGGIDDGVVVFQPAQNASGKFLAIAAGTAQLEGGPAHYDPPLVVTSPEGKLLLISGYFQGTGNFNASALYLYENGNLQKLDADSWLRDLHLPDGLEIWKGVYPDYKTLTATTSLWRKEDANCCPTGGQATIRLGIDGNRLAVREVTIVPGVTADQK